MSSRSKWTAVDPQPAMEPAFWGLSVISHVHLAAHDRFWALVFLVLAIGVLVQPTVLRLLERHDEAGDL